MNIFKLLILYELMAVALSAPSSAKPQTPGKNVSAGRSTGSTSAIVDRRKRNKSSTHVTGLPVMTPVMELAANGESGEKTTTKKKTKGGSDVTKRPSIRSKTRENKNRKEKESKRKCPSAQMKKVENSTRNAIKSFRKYYVNTISKQPFANYTRQLMDIVNRTEAKPNLTEKAIIAREILSEAINSSAFRNDPTAKSRITEVRDKLNGYLRKETPAGLDMEPLRNFILKEENRSTQQKKVCAVLCLLQNTLKEICHKGKPKPEFPCE